MGQNTAEYICNYVTIIIFACGYCDTKFLVPSDGPVNYAAVVDEVP